jgi:hypothetical protein
MATMVGKNVGYVTWDQAAAYSELSVSTLRNLVRAGLLILYKPTEKRSVLSRKNWDSYIESTARPAPE